VSCTIPQACLEQIVPLTADFLAKMEAASAAKVEERKRRAYEWYHEKGGKEKMHEWYHEKGGKEKKAVSNHEYHEKNKLQRKAARDSEEGVKLRNEKKAAAVAAMAAANGGKGYTGLGNPTSSGSYKIQYHNFLQEKAGFNFALTIKDVDGAALAFAKLHEVRAQLLGETYQSDSMYKQRVEDTAYNGSSYGGLGPDAAKEVLQQTAKALKGKLPAGKCRAEWLTGWLAEWEARTAAGHMASAITS
jgi:hypothetical protein